jgi:hypothetical protein
MSEQRRIGYKWNLRQIMAQRNLWKTTELIPLLKSRGIGRRGWLGRASPATPRPGRCHADVAAGTIKSSPTGPMPASAATATSRPSAPAAPAPMTTWAC